jgi:hypothetical protein
MRKKDVEGMDPVLKAALGFDITPDEVQSPDDPRDPIGDIAFKNMWGFDRPGVANTPATKAPLTRAQIAEALQNLSKTLGKPGFTSTAQLIQKLAQAARDHLAPDDPIRGFLEGYAAKDRTAMRSAVKKLVQASRDEIIQYAKAGGNPLELLVKDDNFPN